MICIRNGLVFDAVHEIPEKKDIRIRVLWMHILI